MAVVQASLGLLLLLAVSAASGSHRSQTDSPVTIRLEESRCDACIRLIGIAKAYVSNPTTQQRLMNIVLEDLCPKLPADARTYCAIYAPIGVAAVAGYIESADANEICGNAKLCPGKEVAGSLENTPAGKIVATLLKSPAGDRLLAAAAQPSASSANDDCDTCKMAVIEVAAILGDPDTQKQILSYAEEACDRAAEFHDQCLTYVQMYGPLLLNAAVAYMTPDLCIRLGICLAA